MLSFRQMCPGTVKYLRACLKIVIIPKRWLFFRHTLPIFLGIHQVFLRQIGFAWRKNPSPLGTFPIFKQRLTYIFVAMLIRYLSFVIHIDLILSVEPQ